MSTLEARGKAPHLPSVDLSDSTSPAQHPGQALWNKVKAHRRAWATRQLAAAYSPDAVIVEEATAPRSAYVILYAVVALVLSGIVWASFSHVDRVVSAEGKLVTTAPRINIQPLEAAVVRSLDVRVGQVVRAGQVLAHLDPTFADADVASSRATLGSVAAQIKRLESELEGVSQIPFDPALPDDRLQMQILSRRTAEHQARMKELAGEIADLEQQRATLASDQHNLRGQVTLLGENESMRRGLMEKEIGSRVTWLEAKYQLSNLERDLAKSVNQAKETEHKLSAARARADKYQAERRAKLGDDLATAQREHARMQEQARKADRMSNLVELTAPRRAVVLSVADVASGSVVRQGETLLTMVPLDVPLEAEVSVHPRDIGHIRLEDPARIKIEAFSFQKHGVLTGAVAVVGEDIIEETVNGTKVPLYKLRVSIPTDQRLKDVPTDFRLIPGMSVTTEIKVGERSVMSYFLYPVIRALDTGLREP